jgi:hypothetical protein
MQRLRLHELKWHHWRERGTQAAQICTLLTWRVRCLSQLKKQSDFVEDKVGTRKKETGIIVLCKTHFNSLALMRPCSPPRQLFAATASMLPSTLPPLHHADLKGYSAAVSSELGNYRYLHGAKLYVFRD